MFLGEAWLIERAVGERLAAVEHIGSTSVSGLAAEPIVDIMAGVVSLRDSEASIRALADAGYQYRPDQEDYLPERRYLIKPSDEITPVTLYHLHIVEISSDFWTRHLLFRGHLRSNPDTAAGYVALKRRLAARHGSDRAGYADAKTGFVRSVEQTARAGRAGRPRR